MTATPRADNDDINTDALYPFWQIGTDQGFLPGSIVLDHLLVAPAERADVIVDFTGLEGTEIFLVNDGPDVPFGGIPDNNK